MHPEAYLGAPPLGSFHPRPSVLNTNVGYHLWATKTS